jgi:cell division protein FtsI (penicillin-binding protein 3)
VTRKPLPAAARPLNYATSPLLASRTPPWRSRFVVFALALAFIVLAGRAVWVQAIHAPFYQAQGERRFAHTMDLPASRGRILDRHGTPLATSVAMVSVAANPREFKADAAQRRELARLLGLSVEDIQRRLDTESGFVWLKRKIEPAVWEQVRKLRVRGLSAEREYQRRYPFGEATAHVVGFTDIEDAGQEGVELAFDKSLQGRPGARRVLRDRLGGIVEDLGARVEPRDGQDVTLSIDGRIQYFAAQRLREAVAQHGAQAGSAVVLDARTGEVLALANAPSFDPVTRRGQGEGALRNRALTDVFEPGSTMKPFVAAWAMETGRVKPGTQIDTAPGMITMGKWSIRDHKPLGVLSVSEVIQKSSNVGTVKMAMQMQPRELWELFNQVGFGHRPQLEFPGAVTGRLKAWKAWKPVEQATMSYGYGLSASLFQLARAYTVFAHDGEVMPMTILRRDEPPQGLRVMSASTAREMRQMLKMATAVGGTAPKAQAVGYSVGGKTGTARKQQGREYVKGRYRAWFVGMAPIDKPRIVVAVMVDEPTKGQFYGGDVAAPVFAQVVEHTLRTLGVPNDIPVRPTITVTPGMVEAESF